MSTDAERRRGFTLLEVMGAVIILGIVAIVLVRAASEALGAAGDARRTLDANLVAEEALVELEATAAVDAAPEIGAREYDREDLHVVVEVAPIDPAAIGLESLLPARGDPATKPPALLTASREGAPLLRADVRVSWAEGFAERTVTRSTFLLVPSASPELQSLAPAPGEGPGGDAGAGEASEDGGPARGAPGPLPEAE